MAYPVTMHGLHEWTKAEFEKLGWMILAQNRGMTKKVAVYKESLDHLVASISAKMSTTKDADRKADLQVLLDNVSILREHVTKDFPTTGGKKNRNDPNQMMGGIDDQLYKMDTPDMTGGKKKRMNNKK
jgi:hypothetical protein